MTGDQCGPDDAFQDPPKICGVLEAGRGGNECPGCTCETGGDGDIPNSNGGDRAVSSSCSSCVFGGGSTGAAYDGIPESVRARSLYRFWIPNNRASYGSFSPGHYSSLDSHIQVFPETGGNAITYFDVYAKSVYLLVDGLEGDTLDGVYHDLRNESMKKLSLLTSTGTDE